MELSLEAIEIIKKSDFQERLNEIVALSDELMKQENLCPTSIQSTIMINHLNEMIRRAEQNEKIPEVEPEMFNEVSATSMEISEKIVEEIGNLSVDEKYVLSIHFESIKNN